MSKATKWRLAKRVKRAAALAMSAILMAGSLSMGSIAAESDGAASASSNSVSYEVIELSETDKLEVKNQDGEDGSGGGSSESDPNEPNGFVASKPVEGITYEFNFADAAAKVYDLNGAAEAAEGAAMKSAGLVTVNGANGAVFHDKQHGSSKAMNIDIAVAGTAKVSIYACQFTGADTYTMASATGTVTPATQDAKVDHCDDTVDFYYKGGAGSINFVSTGGYLHKITVTPIEESEIPGGGGGDGGDTEVDPSEPNGFVAPAPVEGISYEFNFADTSAKIYDLKGSAAAVQGTAMKNAGLMTVNSANKAVYHSEHGVSNAMDVDIAVAGTVKVSIYACQFTGSHTYAMTSTTGVVTPVTQSADVGQCNSTVDFYYKGGAGSVNLISTGGYLHKITVTPIEESEIPDFGGGDTEVDPNDPNGFIAPAPVKGIAYNFNFADTTAKIYDLKGAVMAAQGTGMKNAGLVTVNSANQSVYWNDHGASGAMDIEIAVAGDCKINILACAYSGDADTYTVSSDTGTISDPATQNAKVSSDKAPVTYTYTGGEGSIRLVSTGGYVHGIDIVPIIKRENRKIEVWDFAEVQENDAALYHNNITSGFWAQSGLIGSNSGKADQDIELEYTVNASKTVNIGDLTMRYQDGDRIYGDVTGKHFAPYSTMTYEDGYKADGLWYCNGTGGTGRRYVIINNVEAGDKVVVYMGSHTKENNLVHFQYQGGDASQDDTAEIGYQEGRKYEFIAKHDGAYKIYVDSSTNVKPFWHRIMVVPGAKVSGSVDLASAQISGYGLKFVNNTTQEETIADVAEDGGFTVTLAPGYQYTAVLTGVVGYGLTNESKIVAVPDSAAVEGVSGVSLAVEQKDVQKFSGTFAGFGSEVDMTAVKVVLVAAAGSQKENVSFLLTADGAFEAYVESGVSYTITMEGVNDYELTGNMEVLLTAAEEREVAVAKKAVSSVSGSFLGLEGDAAVTSLKFVNMEDDYEYAASVSGNTYSISLRNGTYEAAAVVSVGGYTTISHVVVDGSAVERDLLFVTNAKVTAIPFVSDIYVGYPDKDNNYKTVRDAVRACEGMRLSNATDRITVHIAPGIYREQIIINVPYVTFTNDEPEKEVKLTWYYGVGYQYYSIGTDGYYSEAAAFDKFGKNSAQKWGVATYIKSGAVEFRAENITFESSFNKYVTEEEIADGVIPGGNDKKDYDRTAPDADVTSKAGTERAAAVAVEGNRAEFYQCRFISSQDTLYTGNNINGYFKNCYIEGNTDYIFGGGDFVYDGCELNFFGYSDKENGGYITAAADGSTYGYVFRNCFITGNKDMKVGAGDLGRPWRATATVSYLNTKLEYAKIILPRGWNDMSGNLAKDANYAEYHTTAVNGDVVDLSGRVTGVKTDNPIPDISVVFKGWTPVYYRADAGNIAFDKELTVKAPGGDSIEAGDVLTADFSLGENEYNNVSVIRWYRVAADGTEKLVKSAVAQFDREYIVTAEDKDCHIKAVVLPETVSGYTAAEQTATSAAAVGEKKPEPSPDTRPIEEIIQDALEKDSVDAAVEEIVTSADMKELSDKMQSDDKVLEQMKKLDERCQGEKQITVKIEVVEEAESEIDNSKVDMVGAAVNAQGNEAVLKVSKPEKPVEVEDEKLTKNVQLDIKLTSGGKEIKELKVPMVITLPLPSSLRDGNMDTLVLLHYADDGTYEEVSFKMSADCIVTFTVSHFSTFVFAKEGGAAPEESPSPAPEESPSPAPEESPSPAPEESPSPAPEGSPSPAPGESPSPAPEGSPSPAPGESPSPAPGESPSPAPEGSPSPAPEESPSPAPDEDDDDDSDDDGEVVETGSDVSAQPAKTSDSLPAVHLIVTAAAMAFMMMALILICHRKDRRE